LSSFLDFLRSESEEEEREDELEEELEELEEELGGAAGTFFSCGVGSNDLGFSNGNDFLFRIASFRKAPQSVGSLRPSCHSSP
jgi:hypothetical protein